MKISTEDIVWLRHALRERTLEGVPAYERSRLLVLELVEVSGGALVLTEKGRKLLAESTFTGGVTGPSTRS